MPDNPIRSDAAGLELDAGAVRIAASKLRSTAGRGAPR